MGKRGGGSNNDDNDCGYKSKQEGDGDSGTITIYPTKNSSKCNVTVAIGDAEITFNPDSPPDELKAIISGDGENGYNPPIDFAIVGKHQISFSDLTQEEATVTTDGADGETIHYQKVHDLAINEQEEQDVAIPSLQNEDKIGGGIKIYR